ncbi:hypothetical protein EUGRSUZ_H05109 [Eucalyptus grandis]|uniref:Uncharacterized protein n=2 Tax=Eucalyptus grandis TaxID=71139 RepID=A0ACC3JZE4_EUCGR|nr:hypothetical protein EUGRSUZ_H05109 [Eucalyptus grandis]
MLPQIVSKCFDSLDDGHLKRTGTLWTASANIITGMVGAGVLCRSWDIAQLGWIAGPAAILLFSFVGYYTSRLLSHCYRTGDPYTGERNSTYRDSVHSILGGANFKACGFFQYITLFGNAISCIVQASLSMMAIKYMHCFHENGENSCHVLANPYMIMFGITEILLSQIQDLDQIWWLSIVAAVMFIAYSLIGLGLVIAQVADTASGSFKGSLTVISVGDATETQKIWRCFQALGNIAPAYSFYEILIETQDTIGSPPSEVKTMKKAISLSTVVMTTIYMLCGCVGYAAFGDDTPANFLIDLGFNKPFCLLDIANSAIVIHLVGAYQANSQPIFALIEKQADQRWPRSELIAKEMKILVPGLGQHNMKLFRLAWRTVFVILTTVISMLFPFVFNKVVDMISLGFWPLMVYFPVKMYIRQKLIPKWTTKWVYLQMLSMACLVISIVAAAGSVPGLKDDLKTNRPYGMSYDQNAWTFS